MKINKQQLNQKGNVEAILAAIVLVVIVVVGYWYVRVQNETTGSTSTSTVSSDESSNIDISDWKTYTSDELGVSFKYPAEMEDVSVSGQDKLFLRGKNQPKFREVIDGLMILVNVSVPVSDSLENDLYNDLIDLYFVSRDDFHTSFFKERLLVKSTVGGNEDEIYRMVFQVKDKYLHISFVMGEYDRELYRQIRNSIIDSIEFEK